MWFEVKPKRDTAIYHTFCTTTYTLHRQRTPPSEEFDYPPGSSVALRRRDPKTQRGSSLALLETRRTAPGSPFGFRPSGSPLALLGETPRPQWTHQVLYLGRPQDPYGFVSCSTWGDPKTALTHRTGLPLALLGETPRPHAGYAQWLAALTHKNGLGSPGRLHRHHAQWSCKILPTLNIWFD